MTRNLEFKIVVAAAGAAALAVALGAAGAVAASGGMSPKQESQAVIDDAADRLGVEPSELSNALKEALKNRVDAAVAAGRLTDGQGNELKARIDAGETPLLFGALGGHGPAHFGHFGHPGHLDAAAAYLGVDEAELRERLSGGESLADVAEAEDKSVDGLVQTLVKAAKQRLDEAVADGRLTQDRADALAEGLDARITDLVNGQLPERGFGHRFGGDEGPGFGRHGFRA